VPTICRICESQCGLIADVDGDRIISLRPDHRHPISAGYACPKGTRFDRIHHHPERLDFPSYLGNRIPWDQALKELGGRIRALQKQHGKNSVALYLGNAAGQSIGTILGAERFKRGIGTRRSYSCLTLDNAGMFVVAQEVFGNPVATFVADYGHSDCILLIGTDPLASQPSQSQSNPSGIRELLHQGQALVVVDPRRSATARHSSWHLPIRPGTDLFLLAGLINQVLAAKPQEPALTAAVNRFTPELVARETGISVADQQLLVERLLKAKRPLVWSGLGVLLGEEGTLGWWLTVCLQGLLGGFGNRGGWLWQPGPVDVPKLAKRIGLVAEDFKNTARTGHPAILGTLAAATLPDDILKGEVKALVVVGGNPLVALPDTVKAEAAFKTLDLLICIDLFANDTGKLAHALLPAADWLEREEVPIHNGNQRPRGHLQLARRVLPPRAERREDWTILDGLARAAGAWGPWGTLLNPKTATRALISTLSPVRWRELEEEPRGVVVLCDPYPPPAKLAIPRFLAALEKITPVEAAREKGFRLITSVRPVRSMNSWIGDKSRVAAFNPGDWPGAQVELKTATGSLIVEAIADPDIAPGTVVLAFGSLESNPNRLIGIEKLDAFTGQPISNGVPVEVVAR
jgi:formate dehydrogenase